MATQPRLDKVIPLPDAAKRLGVPEKAIVRLVNDGIVEAVRLKGGSMMVKEDELEGVVLKEQFAHLRGVPITIAQATEKYELSRGALRKWIDKEYISVIEPGYGAKLDEADVAYCAAVYHARDIQPGQRVFDEDGKPYQLKKPEWAVYQRERRGKLKKKNGRKKV